MRLSRNDPFGAGFASIQARSEQPQAGGQQPPQQSQSMNMAAWQQPMQFGSMADGQRHQDAFVQQFLRDQSQYNQGLRAGQQPQRVDVGQAWNQAGDNIASGAYQGNPFATGNVDALMGMFSQYGIQAPEGFRDQLISNLGQQSTPPALPTQPPNVIPRPTNPATGLPYGQQPPMTGYPVGPGGEYWIPRPTNPATGLPYGQPAPQMGYPGGPMPPAAPGYGGRIGLPPGSAVTMDFRDRDGDMIDDRYQRGPGQPPTAAYGQQPPAAGSPRPPAPQPPAPWQPPPPPPWGYRDDAERRTAEHQSYLIWLFNQNQNPATLPHQARPPQPSPQPPAEGGELRIDQQPVRPRPPTASPPAMPSPQPPQRPVYGNARDFTNEQLRGRAFSDSDGDGIDDAFQSGPGGRLIEGLDDGTLTGNRTQWASQLRPGMQRGPSGEQVMSQDAKVQRVLEMQARYPGFEPVYGRTPRGREVVGWRPRQGRAGSAQPVPERGQGTPLRPRSRS